MQIIESNKYFEILVDMNDSVMMIRWKDSVHELIIHEYEMQMLRAHEYVKDFDPRFLIHDGSESVYPHTDVLDKWIIRNISPIYSELDLEKIAYVYPKDKETSEFVINVVSTAKERFTRPERGLFASLESALQWLLGQANERE